MNAPDAMPHKVNRLELTRQRKKKLIAVFGERMKEARQINCLSQEKAAELLGYENGSKLSKVENCTSVTTVSLPLVIDAAELYDVSTDYLLGFSDDWERDVIVRQENQLKSWLHDQFESARVHDLNNLRLLAIRLTTIEGLLIELVRHSEQCNKTFNVFVDRNTSVFEEHMLNGAKLQRVIGELNTMAQRVKAEMLKLRRELGDNAMTYNVA